MPLRDKTQSIHNCFGLFLHKTKLCALSRHLFCAFCGRKQSVGEEGLFPLFAFFNIDVLEVIDFVCTFAR